MKRALTLTSAVTPGLTYDSRDHFFAPTEGTKSAFSVKTGRTWRRFSFHQDRFKRQMALSVAQGPRGGEGVMSWRWVDSLGME